MKACLICLFHAQPTHGGRDCNVYGSYLDHRVCLSVVSGALGTLGQDSPGPNINIPQGKSSRLGPGTPWGKWKHGVKLPPKLPASMSRGELGMIHNVCPTSCNKLLSEQQRLHVHVLQCISHKQPEHNTVVAFFEIEGIHC